MLAHPGGQSHHGHDGELGVHDPLAARGVDGDLDVPDLADRRVLQVQVEIPPQLGGAEAGAEAVLAAHAVIGERDAERGGRQGQCGNLVFRSNFLGEAMISYPR